MVKFKKINEKIESIGKYSFLIFKELESEKDLLNFSDYEIIDSLIKSEFHLWLGENRNEKHNLPNIYGYYNYDELNASDYTKISHDDFIITLNSAINDWHVNEPLLTEKAEKFIKSNITEESSYFHLDVKENDKRTEWNIYSVFAGFIAINRFKNIISLIEFGED